MGISSLYFDWLQKDNPTGHIDQFPALANTFETSISGLYCIGDLTGIPLIKLAIESGSALMDEIHSQKAYHKQRSDNLAKDVFDIIIIGAGPSGIAAGLKAQEFGYRFLILEASRTFHTIHNFPMGKPIFVTPPGPTRQSSLTFTDGSKESLLDQFYTCIQDKNLPIQQQENVKIIIQNANHFTIQTNKNEYKSLRTIVAIGKSGNARTLGVEGEKSAKVFNRLIDPTEHVNKHILVVGGGDSAVETAIALAKNGNEVSLSYRNESLSRPKQQNIEKFESLVKQNKIHPLFSSTIKKIHEHSVVMEMGDGEGVLKNDIVFTLLGTEIPIKFFKRSKIKMEGERSPLWWLNFAAMFSFFFMMYFGKSGTSYNIFHSSDRMVDKIVAYLTVPFTQKIPWHIENHTWLGSLEFLLGWLGSLFFLVSGSISCFLVLKDKKSYFSSNWLIIKNTYLIIACIFFTWIYFRYNLSNNAGWAVEPTYWYSFLYCTTMFLFGAHRILSKPTRYILYQTITLLVIQIFFLFVFPFHLYESTIALWFEPESYVMREIFPQGKWSAFALILFWPLNLGAFGSSMFWTWFSLVQTFVILPIIILRWGKGVYCGWICSCGGMAETFGDEYRTKSPHGPGPKKMENLGQVILWIIGIITGIQYLYHQGIIENGIFSGNLWALYKFCIDVFFAGVIGLGCYFFFGGRIWCRFGCPLAALMHIYTRFSLYRIMADKKRCISCNICTKVCHMGIDVMNYANKGIPMNDVECVRCSSCIVNCPMQVLTFGNVTEIDLDNVAYKKQHFPIDKSWKSGLPNP